MTAQNELEHSGTLSVNPFAELLVEIMYNRFSGSLRLSNAGQKAVVYFRSGEVVFAVSNSKGLRIFNLLLKRNRIDARTVSKYPNFANDIEFTSALIRESVVSQEEVNQTFVDQIEEIIVEILTWPSGEWTFSPLVRVREALNFAIDVHRILIDYGRCAGSEHIRNRFKSYEETFAAIPERSGRVTLQAHESFILSRFEGTPRKISELKEMSAMPEDGLFQALYVLWLGGLLVRSAWNTAFSPAKIGEIRTALLSKVRSASDVPLPEAEIPLTAPPEPEALAPEPVRLPTVEISLEEYLQRIEKAETHYDALGIETDADQSTLKVIYFSLAKLFHPDRYHREPDEILGRIQSAFTSLAHAYETLKTPESRAAYDSKMYRELEAREKRRAAGQPDISDVQDRKSEQGLESFEEGLNMLNDEEYDAAAAYLARAVHYSPQNAIFHAYYGKALSADRKQKHKAESEFQTAVRLDPKNSKIRVMLVEFLVEQNMMKRAEGELNRYLELVPDDREARSMLAKILK